MSELFAVYVTSRFVDSATVVPFRSKRNAAPLGLDMFATSWRS